MLELDLDLVRLSQIRLMDEQRVAGKFFSKYEFLQRVLELCQVNLIDVNFYKSVFRIWLSLMDEQRMAKFFSEYESFYREYQNYVRLD